MTYEFNPPPGWPIPPAGWVPPAGWQPDPSWPPAPQGWAFWLTDTASFPPVASQPNPVWQPAPVPAAPIPTWQPAPPLPAAPTGPLPAAEVVSPGAGDDAAVAAGPAHLRERAGLFGPRRKDLEAENARLTAIFEQAGGQDAAAVAAWAERVRLETQTAQRELDQLRATIAAAAADKEKDIQRGTAKAEAELARVRNEIVAAQQKLNEVNADVITTSDVALLQEVGIYEYRHPLSDSVAYKGQLADVKDRMKALATRGEAVLGDKAWTVNGSARAGAAMIRDYSKLMLRAYNAEADNCVRTLRPHTLASAIARLDKSRNVIAKLGKTMNIRVSDAYHHARVTELELTADYLAKVDEEKERIRGERERQRDEEAARREIEREKARLAKEHAHYTGALAKLLANGDHAGAADVQAKLDEVTAAIAGVEAREANIRAGYVYVISNVGSFGERMVKIGMTRRLEPLERVRELGDASVPFRFDVHALIFSEDAVGLETRLHNALAANRVNRVNARREFFFVTPAEVKQVVATIAGQHLLEYRDVPEALEWRASGAMAVEGPTVYTGGPLLPSQPQVADAEDFIDELDEPTGLDA